jgi:hypothetical protein
MTGRPWPLHDPCSLSSSHAALIAVTLQDDDYMPNVEDESEVEEEFDDEGVITERGALAVDPEEAFDPLTFSPDVALLDELQAAEEEDEEAEAKDESFEPSEDESEVEEEYEDDGEDDGGDDDDDESEDDDESDEEDLAVA